MIEVARQDYPDRDTLMRNLAQLVADQLRAAHATKQRPENEGRRRVTLAVPGGTTPGPFLAALSNFELAWEHVDVIATDERMVPEYSDRANSKLIRENLLRNAAIDARFIHYHAAGAFLEPVLAAMRERVSERLPIDVLVLGMGADMHTASLFPDAPGLAEALADDAPTLVRVEPAGQPEARLTLSAPALRGAEVIHVLITGEDKLAALDAALADGPVAEAPVRVALTAPCPVTVHYAA
ncbi:6-phosphogluconolactonase [Amaricoccus sp.]|uniref:6-phosphogluconolactonase n=1 Tax=Amaricoccus sp. TaxID=1872485 RepID=UPI0025BA1037|nr:6-phosphogluconolactonase [Amaricoccus sp.]